MKKYIVTILILIIGFAVLNVTGAAANVKNFSYDLLASTQKAIWQESSDKINFLSSFLETSQRQEDLNDLEKKNKILRAELIKLQTLREENKNLREALNLELNKGNDLIFSQIVSKNVAGEYILIDKGSKDGIEKGLPVITSEKILCGKVEKVYEDYSEVMLISNEKSVFSAKIEGKKIEASAKGEGNGKLSLDLIPKDMEVEKGEMVYTSQLGGLYPEGLLVGKIKEVNDYDLKPYKQAEIELDCQLGHLNSVFILKNFSSIKNKR